MDGQWTWFEIPSQPARAGKNGETKMKREKRYFLSLPRKCEVPQELKAGEVFVLFSCVETQIAFLERNAIKMF